MNRTPINDVIASVFEGAQLAEDFEETGIVRNVAILGSVSQNNRRYLPNALEAARKLAEGASWYLNHPMDERGRVVNRARNIQDKLGRFFETRVDAANGRVIGHAFVLRHHRPFIKSFLEDPSAGGNSIRADGVFEDRERTRVSDLTTLHGIELVADPATTRSLFESMEHAHQPDTGDEIMDLAELKQKHPEIYKAACEEALAEHKDEGTHKALVEERDKLRKENDELKAANALAERKAKVEQLIDEAKIPAPLVTDLFKQQLIEAKDDDAVKALIEDRKAISGKATFERKAKQPERDKSILEQHRKGKGDDEDPLKDTSDDQLAEAVLGGVNPMSANVVEISRARAAARK